MHVFYFFFFFHVSLLRFVNRSALLTKFFPEMSFRTSALECLTEIAGLSDLDAVYNPLFQQMFVVLVKQVGGYFLKRLSHDHCHTHHLYHLVWSLVIFSTFAL